MCLFWLTSWKERKENKPLIAFSVKSMLVAQGYFVFSLSFRDFFENVRSRNEATDVSVLDLGDTFPGESFSCAAVIPLLT